MHIRRALLLFAIVLGMAALVAALSRPAENRNDETTAREPSEPGPATAAPSPPAVVSFDAAKDETKRLERGTAATLEVSVAESGNVQIPGLGLSAAATPVTPARFDILATDPGEYELLFAPAGGEASEAAGKLVVTSTG